MSIDLSTLPVLRQQAMKEYPRGADNTIPITNSCNVPYYTLSIDFQGHCFICKCEAWIPIPVCNILDCDSLEDVWNSPIAKAIQQDVDDKKFTYCAVNHCNITKRSYQETRYEITLTIDESCNLACPTCRSGMRNITSGPQFDRSKKLIDHFTRLIEKFNQPTTIIMCGNGDVLASMLYRPMLLNWQPLKNHEITLRSNGLLMKKLLPDSPVLQHIKQFEISIDAGTKEVYEKVRRPGKYEVLIENLEWLYEYRKNQPVQSTALYNLVLQADNAADIVNFTNLCKQHQVDACVTKLDNWGAQPLHIHNQMQVLNTSHPLYSVAMEQVLESYNIYSRFWASPLIEQQAKTYKQNK